MPSPPILKDAHGTAEEGGAVLVAETTQLRDLGPGNAERTATGLALRVARGHPFQPGNRAAADRAPSVVHVNTDPDSPEEQRKVERRARSLKARRKRELSVQTGGPVSSGVEAELKSWALAMAWSDFHYRAGDSAKGAWFADKASAHLLKATGFAEREAAARPRNPGDALAAIQARLLGGPTR